MNDKNKSFDAQFDALTEKHAREGRNEAETGALVRELYKEYAKIKSKWEEKAPDLFTDE